MSPRLDAMTTIVAIMCLAAVLFAAYIVTENRILDFLDDCRARRAHNRAVAARRNLSRAEIISPRPATRQHHHEDSWSVPVHYAAGQRAG